LVYERCEVISRFEGLSARQGWRSIGGMLGRMIDRASDFCKYDSDTDYRGIVMEEQSGWDDALIDIERERD
jgi:hypothetical protein